MVYLVIVDHNYTRCRSTLNGSAAATVVGRMRCRSQVRCLSHSRSGRGGESPPRSAPGSVLGRMIFGGQATSPAESGLGGCTG